MTGRYLRLRPIDDPGYETEPLNLAPDKTALVVMHCWDIGCEGGPAIDPEFAVGMGFRQSFAEAERIMKQRIAPAMEAARRCNLAVCHVENMHVALKDPRAQEDMDPLEPLLPEHPDPVIPGWGQFIHERAHGKYLNHPPYSEMSRAKVVAPLDGEIYVFQTAQFDRALRRRGIQNLIYTGFATDMCILRAPGGSEPMLARGYRVFLMRDATLGVEYPDTFEQGIATFWGIRYFETHCGDTITFEDFVTACRRLEDA